MPGRTPPPPPPRELPRVMLWRLRRNPLRRRGDLLQAWLGIGLVLAALAATPLAMFLVGDVAHDHYTRTARHQAETRHDTTATLLEDARRHPEPGSAEAKKTRYPTKVRCIDRNGHTHTATADVQPALTKGSIIRVWAGTDGKLTDPPLSPRQVRDRAVGSAVIAALAVQATAAVAYGTVARIIDRRNLAAWDTAWAETAPRWTTSP
ncbi:Rv1733c family protein [Streptomyces longisporus]|uniref:Proline rich protein membrane protein n=1 Tax=Streptomyces longisporus TaxID=1948 RepID=A0ABP5ZAY3_STRLO